MSTGARSISRRTFLRGSSVAVALPLLEAMVPSRCFAAAPREIPQRMAFLMVPNGMHMKDWTPSGEGKLGSLPSTLQVIEEFRDQFNILSGLTLDGARAHGDGGGDHARANASFLTGAHPRKTDGADINNGVSVDQLAAEKVGPFTRFASLELGLEGSSQGGNCDSGYSCAYSSNLAWRGPQTPVAKEVDPAAVFDRLFGGQTQQQVKRISDPKTRYRQSVLDFAIEDAKQLQQKLGAEDKRKLDEYLYAVRDVEQRIVAAETLSAPEVGVPDYPRPAGVPASMKEHAELMLDMIVLALQTDSTRVISFAFTNEGSNRGYPEIDVPEGHHDCSHHGGSEEKQTKVAAINRFHIGMFGHLLKKMSAVKEGGNTLLHNSMVLYGSGISDGDAHNHDDLPILLAGNACGKLESGRHLVYSKDTPLCSLYVWMLQRMGVKVDQFGDAAGTLPKLS
jgi:hypothetical protein